MPALGVHHLEGHLLAPLLEPEPPPFPHVALLVSGGHTLLIEVSRDRRATGCSAPDRDDAAGEAFDKTAKLLGCRIRAARARAHSPRRSQPGAFVFPRPMLDRPGLEFSFSGLKTAVLHAVRGRELTLQVRADVARGVQEAIVETPVREGPARARGHRSRGAGGRQAGVSANRSLRSRLSRRGRRRGARVYYPRIEFCTDNAAMIAVAGLARLQAGQHDDLAIRRARPVAAGFAAAVAL